MDPGAAVAESGSQSAATQLPAVALAAMLALEAKLAPTQTTEGAAAAAAASPAANTSAAHHAPTIVHTPAVPAAAAAAAADRSEAKPRTPSPPLPVALPVGVTSAQSSPTASPTAASVSFAPPPPPAEASSVHAAFSSFSSWFKKTLPSSSSSASAAAIAAPAAAAPAEPSAAHGTSLASASAAISAGGAAVTAAAAAAASSVEDHLGGVSHPWLHSVVRFSVNKLLGMEEEEEGMEPQYRTVLCRESLFVPADVELHAKDGHRDGSGTSTDEDAHAQPPLLLETSHFYPKGFHSTPLPVIIVRTPYDRALMRHTAERIVRHGYHVLVQDTRNSPNAAALKVKQQQKLRAAAKAVMAANTIAAAPAAATAAQSSSSTAANAASIRSVAVDPLQAQYVQQPKSKPSSRKSSSGGSAPPRKHSGSATSSAAAAAAATVASAAAAGASSAHPPVTAGPQEFFPIVHESADGLATMDWVTKQPWCDGNISFFGFSYLGQLQQQQPSAPLMGSRIAQYAVVDHKHPALKCIVPVISASRVYEILFPSGSFSLDLAARWLFIMFHPSVTGADLNAVDADPADAKLPSFWRRSLARVVGQRSVIPKALAHLPACELDELVAARKLGFYREMIANAHDPALPFWREKQVQLCNLADAPPLLIIEGWYDLFLQQALRDYVEALAIWKKHQSEVAAGLHPDEKADEDGFPSAAANRRLTVRQVKPYLTVIACPHLDVFQLYRISLTESIHMYNRWLKRSPQAMAHRPPDKSVRIQLINASANNQARHHGIIAKRKKVEAKAQAIAAKSAAAAAGAAIAIPMSSAAEFAAKARQELLDSEWLSFSEFPPPGVQATSFYLHCELDESGEEKRVLRRDAPGEREHLYAAAMARFAERQKALADKNAEDAVVRAYVKDMVDVAIAKAIANVAIAENKAAAAAAAEEAAAPVQVPSPNSAAAWVDAISAAASATASAFSAPSLLSSISRSLSPAPAAASAPVVISAATFASQAASLPPLPPARSHFSCYTYNPRDPTPAVGGATFDVENCGPLDQRAFEKRSDMLVFTSEPLAEPLVVVGFVRATLYVRSNVSSTDFVARLCDVFPLDEWASHSDWKSGSGKSQVLCDGLCRVTPAKVDEWTVEAGAPKQRTRSAEAEAAAQAANGDAPGPDTSGPLLRLDVDMWATGNVFGRGHRIRLHVCSAAHPRWLRSLGGPDPLFCGVDQAIVQHQTVYHDQRFPSALVLPVLPV